jgi:hypothetical protein
MTRLFSYVVQTDYGSAPNPFWNACTLVICKPKIRRSARVGDWIVGTGPASSPLGDIRGMMVYAMQVTAKMPMPEYDAWARKHRPKKYRTLAASTRNAMSATLYTTLLKILHGYALDQYTVFSTESTI